VTAARRSYVPWIIGAAVIAVALIGAVVIGLTRSDDAGGDPAAIVETNAVVIDGASLPEFTDVDAAIGALAPQATGTGFDGLRVELLADGQPTMIGFFAHWCPVCQGEVAELADHLADGGLPDDVRVVAVSTGVRPEEDNYPPSAWFADEQWPAPILLDDTNNSLAEAYGLSAYPFWVVVDADGNVVGRLSGAIGPDQFDALVDVARNAAAA
jgi:thiol-disulfide isomerase/thioredoxin